MDVEAILKIDSKALATDRFKITMDKSVAVMMGSTDVDSFE